MKNTTIIIGIFVLAILVRFIVAFNTCVISSDGPFYISVAKEFADNNYQSAIETQTFHPLYPFLISVFFRSGLMGQEWEWAGISVSILFSAFAIIPLFFITRRVISNSRALTGCVLYAFHPYAVQVSSSILTTGLFIGLFISALWVTIKALESGYYRYFLLSGLLSFLIYLTRPDGIIFLFLSIITVIIIPSRDDKTLSKNGILTKNRFATLTARAMSIFILIIPWILLMTPYLMIIYSIKGKIGISGKADVKRLIGLSPEVRPDDREEQDSNSSAGHLPELTPGQAGWGERDDGDAGITSTGSRSLPVLTGSRRDKGSLQAKKAPLRKYLNGLYLLGIDFIKSANPILFLLLLVGVIHSALSSPGSLRTGTRRGLVQNASLESSVPLPHGMVATNGMVATIVCDTTGSRSLPVLTGSRRDKGSLQERKQSRYILGFVWLVFAIFVCVLSRYAVIYERMSKRYTITLFVMLMPWVVKGIDFITAFIYNTFKKALSPSLSDPMSIGAQAGKKKGGGEWLFYIAVILIIMALSFYTFKPLGRDKIIEKNTGELIRSDYLAVNLANLSKNGKGGKPLIITMRSRISYYACGEMVTLPETDNNADKLFGFISDRAVDYLVLDGRIETKYPSLKSLIGNRGGAGWNIKMEEVSPASADVKCRFYEVYRLQK
ncbi:MAG: glycosyltransferase family 39 protein [Planctomycetota bacterium]|nr:glycosyltransferase family 39 protein [Planctomycetota bacterium]